MTNSFWVWCVENPVSAYEANCEFSGPPSLDAGPWWSFMRYGQAAVDLPEGGQALIAGEHEDFYDPDFYIYNDVVLRDPAGRITILGYPETDFPPTDFHSATLVGRNIYLIGNLGYSTARSPGQTQVLRLEIDGWRIAPVATTGELPGWIHSHAASISEDGQEIIISGGQVCRGKRIIENFDDYALCLRSHVWRRLTHRHWRHWLLGRADGSGNDLWQLRSALWDRDMGGKLSEGMRAAFTELPGALVDQMSLARFSAGQLEVVERLYHFDCCGQRATETQEHGVYRLTLGGTPVRFNEDLDGVTVTIEGELPVELCTPLLQELREKLEAAEQQPYQITDLSENVD
jgi:hypothetical protein